MIFLGSQIYGDKPYIVAEISANHGGELNRALQLIQEAKKAGADAVKIQAYDADALTLPIEHVIQGSPWHGQNLYELYMKSATPYEWIAPLFEHAGDIGIPIFSSVYDERGLEILTKNNCRAFKIASYEANDPLFIQKVVATGKPVVLSTGTLNGPEIARALSILDPSNSIVLHCISKYPCEINELALGEMTDLNNNCSQPVGFSCHSDDPLALIAASLQRAAMIEVHFTLDDEIAQQSPDYSFSFTREGLKYAISTLKEMTQGSYSRKYNREEDSIKLRRSLYVIKDMKQGETFTHSNVKSYRPNLGCDPYLLSDIIGRKANRDIPKYTPMQMEFVK